MNDLPAKRQNAKTDHDEPRHPSRREGIDGHKSMHRCDMKGEKPSDEEGKAENDDELEHRNLLAISTAELQRFGLHPVEKVQSKGL